jgi:hypothetical protein
MVSRANASKVLAHAAHAQQEGHRTYRAIAGYLNRSGIRTSRGKPWQANSVRRLAAVTSNNLRCC